MEVISHLPIHPKAMKHLNAGMFLARRGKDKEAKFRYSLAVNIDPRLSDAWCFLGAIYIAENNYPHARSCLARAIAEDDQNPTAHYNMGYVWYHEGNLEKALDSWYQTLMLQDDHLGAMCSSAIAHEELGDKACAKAHATRFLSLCESDDTSVEVMRRIVGVRKVELRLVSSTL